MISLDKLPPLLQPEVNRFWQNYQQTASNLKLITSSEVIQTLPIVWACSPFVAQACVQNPSLLTELIQSCDLFVEKVPYAERLQNLPDDENGLMQALRAFRLQAMVRIAWRDLAGWATLNETLASLSDLADALIDAALQKIYTLHTAQWGTPCDLVGNPQQLVVLGLGKLGGQELNFSSDVDLIFTYPENGETTDTPRPRSNQEFFLRLGQRLIYVLNHMTADGFVFRVDMRLRPFGDSGPLVMNFAACEEYYQNHARDWERYALVKARVIAGDKIAGKSLLIALKPFIYRRYLDYNAFEALRSMKLLIDQEAQRKGLLNNLKLGKGGIREAEFTCQVFQLIRGGRQPALQNTHFLSTLKQLAQYQLLESDVVHQLYEAYCFLRKTENHLQAIADQQTQTLPIDELDRTRLAFGMGFIDWDQLVKQLQFHQQIVHHQFEQVIAPPAITESETSSIPNHWQTLWLAGLQDDDQSLLLLTQAGFQDPPEILKHLRTLLNSSSVAKMSLRGRERFDKLIPLLLAAVLGQPDIALHRLLDLVEAIALRSVYLALLLERPQVLKQLVHLCANSQWIAAQITRYPLLLDELLDPRRLYDPLKPAELDSALQAQLAHLPMDDLEMLLDCMRQFKRGYVLQVAASEISANLSVEVASDYLAAIADTLVKQALNIAYQYLVEKHGKPYCNDNGVLREANFCVVAYGKAGGIEMSYESDLDIVFLHNSRGSAQMTEGEKPLNNDVFFSRLAQRIIHILTINTPAGILYEVDPRLRPGGASGLLVSSLDAFRQYQQESAWTWEHQALVRARVITGDVSMVAHFESIRRSVLAVSRDVQQLKQDVYDMRLKMRQNLDKSNDNIFDLKQGQGGITDIEFIVQYGILRWAVDYPQLLETTGMLPMLKLFVKYKLFDELLCQQLSEAYRIYRRETHHLALQGQPAQVSYDKFEIQRQQVTHWWTVLFGDKTLN